MCAKETKKIKQGKISEMLFSSYKKKIVDVETVKKRGEK